MTARVRANNAAAHPGGGAVLARPTRSTETFKGLPTSDDVAIPDLRCCLGMRVSGALSMNVLLSAMHIDVPVHNACRIEVLPGAQLAVDATPVSPVTRKESPQDGAAARAVLGRLRPLLAR